MAHLPPRLRISMRKFSESISLEIEIANVMSLIAEDEYWVSLSHFYLIYFHILSTYESYGVVYFSAYFCTAKNILLH